MTPSIRVRAIESFGIARAVVRIEPMRFETVSHAQAELEEFFANVKAAATAGNMDAEENRNHFRIVAVK